MITSASPVGQVDVQRVDELVAVRGAHLDALDVDVAVGACPDQKLGQLTGLLVGLHQAVQPDDRRAIARELVVGVAEEGQPVLNVAERRRGLRDVAELDLTGE